MAIFLTALSIWLHALATIIMIGYYIFISLIFLPIFEGQMQGTALRNMLERVSSRFRPYFGGSLLIFVITGSYLMLINKNYLGLGHFFGNPWSSLIVIKHLLVLIFLVLAIYAERAFLTQISDENSVPLKKFRLATYINTCVGVVIILLTSIAQAA